MFDPHAYAPTFLWSLHQKRTSVKACLLLAPAKLFQVLFQGDSGDFRSRLTHDDLCSRFLIFNFYCLPGHLKTMNLTESLGLSLLATHHFSTVLSHLIPVFLA